MKQYLDCLEYVLENGEERPDRTGTGTIGVFGYQMRFNLQKGFPAVTTKRLAWKAMTSELLWFLEGSDDERRLCEILHGTRDESKRTIWTDNANNQGKALGYEDGKLGPVYGVQWRNWEYITHEPADGGTGRDYYGYEYQVEDVYNVDVSSIDQIQQLIDGIKNDPYGRRHILSAWNVAKLDEMALPPCHCFAQFYVSASGKLSCQLYQRSADVFLGVPFNIASYALLTHMIALQCGLDVGEFVWTGGDVHIYANHVEQVKEQLTREPKELPKLRYNFVDIPDIDSFTMESFELVDYDPMPTIKAPMAV